MAEVVRRDRLQRLQEELLALKASYPDLKLKKTPPAVPGAPFPITVTATIDAPLEASHIDVESLQIKATIVPTSTSSPAADSDTKNEAGGLFSTTLEIVDNSLPSKLKTAILSELNTIKDRTYTNDQSVCHLGPVLSALEKEYARLMLLVPECLERYEGVDAAGRTVRRFAILREDAHITIDTSVPLPFPKAVGAAAAGVGPSAREATSSATSASSNLVLPRALHAELEALKKRYSIQMIDNVDECASMLENLKINSNHSNIMTKRGQQETLAKTPKTALPSSSPIIFNIAVSPTDPDWKPPGSLLDLTCFVVNPIEYPAPGSFGVTLKKNQKEEGLGCSSGLPSLSSFSLTPQESAVCDRLLQIEAAGVAGRPGALRAVLRQCENRAGELFCQAVDMTVELERKRAAAAAAEERKKGVLDQYSTSQSEYSSNSDDWDGHSYEFNSEEGSHEEEEEEEEEEHRDGAQRQEQPLLSGQESQRETVLLHNSLHVILSGLQLVDIDTLDILKLTLQLACVRCLAATEAVFAQLGGGGGDSGNSGPSHRNHLLWKGECTTCHAHLEATLSPRIVHDGSNVLAVLRPDGCVPRDLLPSMLAAQCSSCSNMAAFRSVQIGKWNERNCGHCHRRMAFLAPAIEFSPVQRGGSGAGGGGRGSRGTADVSGPDNKSKSDRDIVITPGQPLPDYGTCRHYRHSKRWLRFPCCGRRFPCDLCHEEATDGHEMKWAGRMVCGYCSVEQPLGQKCGACGKTVATSAAQPSGKRTAFWEGGEGQRDKNRLSKRDPHKYRNSKHKTQSRKDQRVGQKGKEKADRGAAK